jgi:hypothetical protein
LQFGPCWPSCGQNGIEQAAKIYDDAHDTAANLGKVLVERAIKGELGAAEFILKVRAHGLRYGEIGVDTLQISDWLPDYPGQTADQKTRESVGSSGADPHEWWQERDNPPNATNAD